MNLGCTVHKSYSYNPNLGIQCQNLTVLTGLMSPESNHVPAFMKFIPKSEKWSGGSRYNMLKGALIMEQCMLEATVISGWGSQWVTMEHQYNIQRCPPAQYVQTQYQNASSGQLSAARYTYCAYQDPAKLGQPTYCRYSERCSDRSVPPNSTCVPWDHHIYMIIVKSLQAYEMCPRVGEARLVFRATSWRITSTG